MFTKIIQFFFWIGILSFFPLFPQNQEKTGFFFPFSQYQLKNDLQVILAEDDSLPLVSVVVAYNVGSFHERPGKSGLAYLLENLMFLGSQNVGPMQHVAYINKIGGELSAATFEDRTVYYQTVASNQLALVLWLESDRMGYLEITPSKVEQAKNSLLEEIRLRKKNDPFLEHSFFFDSLIYPQFAYSHPILGFEEDIRNLTTEDIRDFYETYYVPNNAVLCIAGHINKTRTRELISKYFESIPRGKDLPLRDSPLKMPEKKAVIQTVQNSFLPSLAFYLGYRIAPPHSNDSYALTILDYILLRGKSSRLYKRLFKKERLALVLSGGIEKRKDVAVYKIFVTISTEIMRERCLKAIFSEINRLKTSLVPEEELLKVKNMFKMDFINRWATNLEKAFFLSEVYLSQKNLNDLTKEYEKYLSVTASDIAGIVNRYFTSENSVLLNIKIR